MLVCTAAVSALAAQRNPALSAPAWRQAVGYNVCAAAAAQAVDPLAIVAIILNENGGFKLGLHMPARKGFDVGLCGANSYYQAHRTNIAVAVHPYACAEIVGQILKENVARYGQSWRAVAAYWSPAAAKAGSAEAWRYYQRWSRNYQLVQTYFAAARTALATEQVQIQGEKGDE
jgi:hypothetical protein